MKEEAQRLRCRVQHRKKNSRGSTQESESVSNSREGNLERARESVWKEKRTPLPLRSRFAAPNSHRTEPPGRKDRLFAGRAGGALYLYHTVVLSSEFKSVFQVSTAGLELVGAEQR